jgi:hypothetical protein
MEADQILALVLGIGLFIGILAFLRELWRVITNRNVAYNLGRKSRRLSRNARTTVEAVAHSAGRASGSVEDVAGAIGNAFRDGRNSARSKSDKADDSA